MSKGNDGDDIFRVGLILGGVCAVAFLLGGVIVFVIAKAKPQIFTREQASRSIKLGLSLLVLGILGVFFAKHFKEFGLYAKIAAFLGIWLLSAAAALLTSPLWITSFTRKNITADDLRNKAPTVDYQQQIGKPEVSIIGTSLKNSKEVFLTEDERVMHTLIAGSTGSGKTTLLKSLYIDACKKGQPVIIIDPKGNHKTVDEFKELAIALGVSPEKFRLFSIIAPEKSQRYNPLARGTAMQIRDRLMGALEWSEQFYKNQASTWLGVTIEILKAVHLEITPALLHKMLVDRKQLDVIEKRISEIPDKERARDLLERLKQSAKMAVQNQDNLISQLKDLDNLEFGFLFDPKDPVQTIELARVIENCEIAYFQLNVMAYEVGASVIGKLLLQDLKSLASQIHGEVVDLKTDFLPIFVDEFGSFAIEGFIDFLKMCRDVRFANHLFFQSLADLDAVSPEFKSQVQANCKTKIVLRTDDPNEVDFWSGVAGTLDAIEASHQTEQFGPITLRTGAGNSRSTKQMRVEHDVFKQLKIGQAVLLQKAPAKEDLIQLWYPDSNVFLKKTS